MEVLRILSERRGPLMLLMSGLLIVALGMLLLPSDPPTARETSRDASTSPASSPIPTPAVAPPAPPGGFLTLVPILHGQSPER